MVKRMNRNTDMRHREEESANQEEKAIIRRGRRTYVRQESIVLCAPVRCIAVYRVPMEIAFSYTDRSTVGLIIGPAISLDTNTG